MDKMELPWRCLGCTWENMINPQALLSWPVDKVISARGFLCELCGTLNVVAFRTVSLEEQMRKLMHCPPQNRKYQFLFKKVLRKAEGVNRRGEMIYGEIRCKDLATP